MIRAAINRLTGRGDPLGDLQSQVMESQRRAELTFAKEQFDMYASLVDRFEDMFDPATGERWVPLGQETTTKHGKSWFQSEESLREARNQCRVLYHENPFARNGHENRISYIVGSGHVYRANWKAGLEPEVSPEDDFEPEESEQPTTSPELKDRVQESIDAFCHRNRWSNRQQEIIRRRDRDGEVFLRYFRAEDGSLVVRFVEPDLVAQPPTEAGDKCSSWGIKTNPDDVETVEGYWIGGEFIEATDIQHRKHGVDSNCKRGCPLMWPARQHLRRAVVTLKNTSLMAGMQSAIAMIRKHANASKAAVQSFVNGQVAATAQNPVTGRTDSFTLNAGGRVLDAPQGVDYEFPSMGVDPTKFLAAVQGDLRAAASLLVMPEFMLTSDASNANYASTMVAEGPAVKMFERLQAEQMEADLQVMELAIRYEVESGRLPPEALTDIEIEVEAPTIVSRNLLQEVQAQVALYDRRIISPQKLASKHGLDYEQEQDNWTEHDERYPSPMPLGTMPNAIPIDNPQAPQPN